MQPVLNVEDIKREIALTRVGGAFLSSCTAQVTLLLPRGPWHGGDIVRCHPS